MGYSQTIMIGNHKKALKIIDQKNYTIEKRENNKYIVNKENINILEKGKCRDDCRIFCENCRICWHNFKCSCDEFIIKKKEFCVHLHIVLLVTDFDTKPTTTRKFQRHVIGGSENSFPSLPVLLTDNILCIKEYIRPSFLGDITTTNEIMGSEEITRNEEICEEENIFKHEVNNKIKNNDSDFNELLEEIQQNASVNNFENITNSFDNSKLLIDEWKKRKKRLKGWSI